MSEERGRPLKVARVIDDYGLSGLGEDLARRWTGDGAPRESLRDLADRVNRRILRVAMTDAGLQPLDGEVADTYRLLTDEGASGGMRTQARRRLDRAGIDPDEICSDFVSHRAVHTYLREGRGVEPPESGDQLPRDRRTLDRLRGRTAAVTESTLDRLDDTGRIDVGDVEVFVDVRVLCPDCGADYDVADLLDRGGCDCSERA